jgi:predicted Zn-dependent peptidase
VTMSKHQEYELSNGLKLLIEPVHGVRSVSVTLLTSGGLIHEPDDQSGLANLTVAMVTRGAGDRPNRALVDWQDSLGLQRMEGAETAHASFSCASVADRLESSLELMADIVQAPHLPADELELCQAGILQEIDAIEDDPGQKLFVHLREASLPGKLGRPLLGTSESVENLTIDDVRRFHRDYYQPTQAILGIAGAVDLAKVESLVERYFGSWKSTPMPRVVTNTSEPRNIRDHVASEKVQTHLGVAMKSIPYADPDYFEAHAAAYVLSGGMSSRLWTEIREKRGLCYTVSASFAPFKELGRLLLYAATTSPDRAAETLDLMLREVWNLREGIFEDEVARVRAGLKASLVMQQESTSARAQLLARHWYNLGRVRPVDEVAAAIDRLTPESIARYLERHPLEEIGIVTLGPEPLEVVT